MSPTTERPPSTVATAGVQSSGSLERYLALHGATMSRQPREMYEQIPRARRVGGLAQLRGLSIDVQGHRLARPDPKPRHLQVPHARALEMLAALHAQHELRELATRHRLDDAHVEQPIANARLRRHERSSAGGARVAHREQQEL